MHNRHVLGVRHPIQARTTWMVQVSTLKNVAGAPWGDIMLMLERGVSTTMRLPRSAQSVFFSVNKARPLPATLVAAFSHDAAAVKSASNVAHFSGKSNLQCDRWLVCISYALHIYSVDHQLILHLKNTFISSHPNISSVLTISQFRIEVYIIMSPQENWLTETRMHATGTAAIICVWSSAA